MDEKQMVSKCLVSTLMKLRESSKDAVVSADYSDDYTMYMHVDRPVQDRFVSILSSAYCSDHSELILLCGSVGDGKSHMLSYCSQRYSEWMSKFVIHNDSTASLYVDKPAYYTLLELMDDFSDEKIETSNKKLILAINLGTLSNFLEEDTDNRFLRLKKYVDDAGILDHKANSIDDDEHFHCVNFADYHLYELKEDGVASQYIAGLIKKITQHSDDNVFYSNYVTCCSNCACANICPVKLNYDLLSDEAIQDGIIRSLIETIVKNKLLVSTRSLLNFIYEILVDERHFKSGSLEPRKEPEKINSVGYFESLLPNTLFGRTESSEILESMGKVDPMRIRNEAADDFFVFYENSDETNNIFKNDLPEYDYLLKRVENADFSDRSNHSIKEEILKTLIRMCWLSGRKKDMLPDDFVYNDYMKALFAWNNGQAIKLKDVYSMVEKGILAWNGPVNKNEMQIPVIDKKIDFHLVQEMKIKSITNNLPPYSGDVLHNFQDELRLRYLYGNHEEAEIEVDYVLFSLLKKVIRGYIPSLNDKRVNVKCVEFIKKISRGGGQKESVLIRDMSHKNPVEFSIEFNDEFGYSFEVR